MTDYVSEEFSPRQTRRIGRRSVLAGAAATAGAMILAGCSNNAGGSVGEDGGDVGGTVGSDLEKRPVPDTLNQAPTIDSSLPPVAERVPEPYVLPHHWLKPGKYGGGVKLPVGNTDDAFIGEYFYSSSFLRFLNDGDAIGPGLAKSWSSNDDLSEWTFELRRVKWSDGTDVTTADVMFWWDDLILYDDFPDSPPDECYSSSGKVCKIVAEDDHTITLTFDSSAPLLADRMATWTNGRGGNGPMWIVPAHYAKKFHPKYNKKVAKDWSEAFYRELSPRLSTKVPTLWPFTLVKFAEGRQLAWERNPYCYEFMPNGDQLPYLDSLLMTVQETNVAKVNIQGGKVDWVMGGGLTLQDYGTTVEAGKKKGLTVDLWDTGTGTGPITFWNYDYSEKKLRELFRDPRFRKAISYAFDRQNALKGIFFEQGVVTTGTTSPKTMEYNVNDEGKAVYEEWRTSAIGKDGAADLEKANALLDEIGLPKGPDGIRTWPDGSKLGLRLDRPADTAGDHLQKDNLLVADLKKVGLDMPAHPVPPVGYTDGWYKGKYQTRTNWEISDGPKLLLYPNWVVPVSHDHWAPLEGEMFYQIGVGNGDSEDDLDPWKRHPPRLMPEPDGPVDRLWKLYHEAKGTVDPVKQMSLVWDMIKIHVEDGPFVLGCVASTPVIVVHKETLGNVPKRDQLFYNGYTNPWIHPVPAVYDPEAFFWSDPENHELPV